MLSDYITRDERLACVKAGALSFAGMLDAALGPLPRTGQTKSADLFGGARDAASAARASVGAAKELALIVALGAGIPLGAFGHAVGKRISGKRLREEEIKEKTRLYQDAANELAAGLGGGGR